jgi:hypothetical protein
MGKRVEQLDRCRRGVALAIADEDARLRRGDPHLEYGWHGFFDCLSPERDIDGVERDREQGGRHPACRLGKDRKDLKVVARRKPLRRDLVRVDGCHAVAHEHKELMAVELSQCMTAVCAAAARWLYAIDPDRSL